MSMKTVLKKLTSMVLVICMFVSLAAPAVGDAPLPQPTEEAVLPDGTTVYADGSLVYADGTIVYADGTTVRADGTTADANGAVVYPDGTMLYADGKMVYADGTAVYPDGTTVYADGTVFYPDGTIVYADGTTVRADGVTVNPDGTTVYPDGTTIYTDGTIVYADGTRAYPDGTVVYADGTTLNPDGSTVYPDGTTVYADGTTLNPDGSTVYPDGTTVYADGTTLKPDGTTVYPDGTTVYADGTTLKPDGSTVYPDGTTVYADGTTLKPDGSTVYPDGTTVYADGTTLKPDGSTVYPDGTTVYADGTTLKPDGSTVYPDGTTVYADGTTVYPDGTTVYPEGSTDPVPEEEPVLAEEPEAVIPDEVPETPEETQEETPAEPTTEETQPAADPATDVETEEITEPVTEGEETENQEAGEPEEDEENKTEETSEETAEGTTEETNEKTTEQTTEQTEEKTAEETADAAPAEELPLRTLTVSADQMAFRDQFLNPKEPVLWSGSVWNALYGTAIEPVYTDGHVIVEISGHLPETVTARAMFVEFADPGAAQNDERALMLLDVALLDETGAFYVPAETLHVSVSDASVYGAVANGEPFAAYFDDAYDGLGDAGDVRVGLDDNIDGDRLAYIPGLRDTLLFWEAGDRLVSTENGTVDFDSNRFPFRFVLSAQQEPREEAQPEVLPEAQNPDEQPAEQQNAVKDVTLSGTLVASDGYTYEVSVNYPADCGLPVGAELSVEELIVGTDAYWDYINQSAAELGVSPAELSLARAFDISLVDPATGVHYQPTQDVRVSILLISTPLNTEEEISVLHFDDEAGGVQAMDAALNGETIEFETSGFSVFTVLQRSKNNNLMATDGTDGTSDASGDAPEKGQDSENGGSTVTATLDKNLVNLEGSWATWKITVTSTVAPEAPEDGEVTEGLTLLDTFSDNQSIDYSSIRVTEGVTYDYSGRTGTYVIPAGGTSVIDYRTRVVAAPGEDVDFDNTAQLLDQSGSVIVEKRVQETRVIYPSASDVADTTGVYMVRFYVYGKESMQSGIQGAQFILLDENRRPMSYKLNTADHSAGDPITFTTDENGFADIKLDEGPGGVSIEKNTQYYLEMIHAPAGYKNDNSLYGFLIKDNPDYNKYEYYNGDTLKVRLYPEEASLNVSVRFSGNYSLTTDQQNGINVILQKKNGENWENLETHSYSEFSYGSLTFNAGTDETPFVVGETYRIIQENQSPWDLDSSVEVSSTYYLIIGSGQARQGADPIEFMVTEDQTDSSFNVIIDNEYEKHELTITKMDKTTGAKLSGAVFTVKKADGDAVVTDRYTTDENGMLIITGGPMFESETLYYAVETTPPTGYLPPVSEMENRIYFYFCNDPELEPSILEKLPAGKTAVNLSETYESLTIDNQKEQITVPVMKTWQGNSWPGTVDHVTVGLYKLVNGVLSSVQDDQGNDLTVSLSMAAPYDNNTFVNLPARDDNNETITYSILEENVIDKQGEDILNHYVQEYGVSDAGVYVVRNREASTLTVNKEWYDLWGVRVTDDTLAAQSSVTFDVYRSTVKISEDIREDGITYEEMADFVRDKSLVRSGQQFGNADGWTKSISDLPKQDDLGQTYYYYILETVPSFGTETYVVDEDDGVVTIRNLVPPETVSVTVQKVLKDDPREEAKQTDFGFTLKLDKGGRPIRSYTVYENGTDSLITDWNGEVTFTLKPDNLINLTLPAGVTATITEAYHPEYTVETSTSVIGEKSDNDRTFTFVTTSEPSGITLTYTNNLHVICKVVNNDGEQIPFESLNRALASIRSKPEDFTSPWTIYMLEDYTIPAKDVVEVREGESLTLTTASTTDSLFPFKGGKETDRAIITRGEAGDSMLKNAGTLTLEKICLDGGNVISTGDGGLVYSTGILNLTSDTTLRNSSTSGRGGAIYSKGTVSMPGGSITGNFASNGSAIYLASGSLNMTGGSITNNIAEEDGAVVPATTSCEINLSGNPVVFNNTNSSNQAANIYLGVDSDKVINVHSPGLETGAKIGVRAMETHREIGEQFATTDYEVIQNLDHFVNDIYGYHGKVKDGTATHVVWDGRKLTIKKVVDPTGANPADTFTLTLTSTSIRRAQYTINSLDYTVNPGTSSIPGSIELRNVKANDVITIEPLPGGSYTLTEAESKYTPTYTGTDDESSVDIDFDDGTFLLKDSSTVTVTNTRRLADVKLTKTLDDRLAGDTPVDFGFTVKLTEAGGTAISDFTLAEGITTDRNGEATFTMSPKDIDDDIRDFRAPVGATMTITETVNSNYRITASAKTMPKEEEGTAITDADKTSDNVFVFTVTDDGADVTFHNEREMAKIGLSKELTGKVSEEESFDFVVTLTREDGSPVANYTMYRDEAAPANNIVTGGNGQADISFIFGKKETSSEEGTTPGEGTTPEEGTNPNVVLTIPFGTSLKVAEEVVKKEIDGADLEIYDTKLTVNGEEKTLSKETDYETYTIDSVSDSETSIVFSNTRKTQTITVTNTVAGYSGNVVPFTYTATVTDGGENENDYDDNGFTDGEMTFELASGQSQVLTVPYGATLTVAEGFIVGYGTTVKRGSAAAVEALSDTFAVKEDVTLAFTNSQLIGLRLVNNTSSTLEDVEVTVGKNKIYRVNSDQTGQELIGSNKTATLSIAAGETAILEIEHETSVTAEQPYTVTGKGPAEGYYYTIKNEPSFHEFADPAVLRFYDEANYTVKGKLRYSVQDSIVTFTEQPLVSFDINGGAWTTEMEGYRDRDGDRQVFQKAVTSGEAVARPTPDPVYSTAEKFRFLGWTTDEDFAKRQDHTADEVISAKAYDFDTPVTAPVMLYAVWAKPARDTRIVTVKNATTSDLSITVTLTKDGAAVASHTLFDDLTTDTDGKAQFILSAGESKNLTIPDEAKLVLGNTPDARAVSEQFEDSDNVKNSFTIASVTRDGTVTYTSGICKITNEGGDVLYDSTGQPAVYSTLTAAFAAYAGPLYTDATKTSNGSPAAVKMLVDEYSIEETTPITFPNGTMKLTTAGKDDDDFPYVGVRDRSTIYRSTAGKDKQCFTLGNGDVTLTNIILDGGSEQGVKIAKTANGGLIYMNNASGVLKVTTGTTMRNCEFADYSDGNNSRGGAIYMTNGTLNVDAGLFTNLHARRGGAICAMGGTLNITRNAGNTRFENCNAETDDGGAIYYNNSKDLIIDGGGDRDNPGIIFTGCVAKSNSSDGGAIYAETTNSSYAVSVQGCLFTECSSRNSTGQNDDGYGGGAIGARNVKGISVLHSVFQACDTMVSGGAVMACVKGSTASADSDEAQAVSIKDCVIENCSCKGQGGAIAVYHNKADRSETNSTTKLYVEDSVISNCSSGTNNGSGGAIQCYLPRLELNNTQITDCWAGKEGGAINHYFGGSYTEVWPNSKLMVTDCKFTRCRAEDRYDPTALQHYGGGINSKAKTAKVTDSEFVDCVSTLKEGGALHLGGQGAGSMATITYSTFKNCMAKNGGGALLSSHETLTIESCNFYGCSSSASNGGAVYHYRNSRGDSTQKYTTIKNSTFSADPEIEGSAGCSAANNGGAIWTRATTNVTLESLTIQNATAGNNGGGVYLDTSVAKATITDGSIKSCQAVSGSAVYVGKTATFSGDLEVSGNACSNVNSGAIHGGKLYFEGNVTVTDNTCSSDSAYDHDVLMQNNNVTTIYTTASGLGEGASIGVYVPDNQFNNRGKRGKAFGTYTNPYGSNNLDCFFNDRDNELYGYQASESDTNIYWGIYICKITDAEGNTLTRPNGKDAVYQRISLALDDFTSVTSGAVYVKMLIENYNLQQTGQIDNFPAADITLTTAGKEEPDGKYPYRGTEGTVCTISRTSGTNQLFKLNNANATFQLENITLDGRNDKTATQGNYRLIEAAAGALVVNGGTTFQYGYDNANGGAIKISSTNASLEIHSAGGKNVLFDHCVQNKGNTQGASGGGAISSQNSVIIDSKDGGKTIFTECNARRGGAIMVNINSSVVLLSVEGAEFKNCYSYNEGGAIYHNNNNNTTASTTIKNTAFDNCYTNSSEQWSYGGAVNTNTAVLTVDACSFKDCYALSNGGAINHGSSEKDRLQTTITNTSFDGCFTAGTNESYGYGGSISTWAKEVTLTDCVIQNSTATNHGGALYCQSNHADSTATVSGTSFENCSTTRNGGYGGAIYSNNLALTLQKSEETGTADTTISNCTAPGYSGAVYMATSGSVLNIKDDTVISGCYADKGGAIYLPDGVIMNLTDSPEFTRNGYTTINGEVVNASEGACIYLAEGSRINLKDSPKFSRNILPNLDRITNGGISDYVRQDLYLAGYKSATNAESIWVVDELNGDIIWVWPEKDPHRMPGEQFAKMNIAEQISDEQLDATLSKLRNALADNITACSDGEYLAGVRLGNDSQNIYWNKMHNISFKKIDNKAVAVPGAEFTLYKDRACERVFASAVSADGVEDTGADGRPLPKGTVDFPAVPIGAYYMKETQVPTSFIGDGIVYLVLVGTPFLKNTESSKDLWVNGPLNVEDAEILVQASTTAVNKYFGIFPLNKETGKADLSKNIASATVGIVNTRDDFKAYFMKTDSSGTPLPGAEFTIYVPEQADNEGNAVTYHDKDTKYPKLKLWSRDGETNPDPVKSADGKTVSKGLVYFRELPIGTYYLVETSYPYRNGSNRKAFFVESDRVFKLEVNGENNFTLSEWQSGGTYKEVDKNTYDDVEYFTVRNVEAVCKLTDGNDTLLYELGLDGKTLHPAIYATLEDGFGAAQSRNKLYNADGTQIDSNDAYSPLKLKCLKDFTISSPIEYDGTHPLTFTTAETSAKDDDRYVFTTNRTTYNTRAEIKRSFPGDALITVGSGASLTLQNIMLDGQKSTETGRAVTVDSGSLTIFENTRLQNFSETDAGGAVLMNNGTTLTIDGGRTRSAVFSGNEAASANGGALALGENCNVISIQNAQFTGNSAVNGGAIYATGVTLPVTNAVFTSNSASSDGGAIFVDKTSVLTVSNGSIRNNSAKLGSAIYGASAGDNEDEGAWITISGGTITGNTASDDDGGAINVGDGSAKLFFGGNVTVFNNHGSEDTQQKNVVLSADSNQIIWTTEDGLTGGRIGVYVIDGETLFNKHGQATNPFGTFGDQKTRKNPQVFTNDRNPNLHGVAKEDDSSDYTIYWSGVEGAAHVMLVKVQESGTSYKALSGKQFTVYSVYTDSAKTVAQGTIINDNGIEEEKPLSDLPSGTGGAFFIGKMPYGTYYVAEEGIDGTFEITIDPGGVVKITDSSTTPKTTEPVKTVNLS